MSAKSISFCQGKGSLTHNNRKFLYGNVDAQRTKDNITYVCQPIGEAYEQCFDESLQRYNDKQKRADRKINTSYYENLFGKPPQSNVVVSLCKRKSFYEDLIQIGTKDDSGVGTADGELATKCLDEYMKGFTSRNANFHVFNAVLHLDEATPHLHINYVPIGHYKRGMDTQNGLAQALKEMGYGGGKDAINRWRLAERKILEDICQKHGIEVAETRPSRGYSLIPDEYKAQKDAEREQLEKNHMAKIASLTVIFDEKEKKVLNDYENKKEAYMGKIRAIDGRYEKGQRLEQRLRMIKSKAKRLPMNKIIMNCSDFEDAITIGLQAAEANERAFESNEKAKEAELALTIVNENFASQITKLEQERDEYKNRLDRASTSLHRVYKVFHQNPEIEKAFYDAERVSTEQQKEVISKTQQPKKSSGMNFI
ncbi:MAG: plasmid recombination protein [Oscillospiraceae bacterium]|nr:plasmid recombination protein [Oscillospiraceae bacterium]